MGKGKQRDGRDGKSTSLRNNFLVTTFVVTKRTRDKGDKQKQLDKCEVQRQRSAT